MRGILAACPHADCGQRYTVTANQLRDATFCQRCGREVVLEPVPLTEQTSGRSAKETQNTRADITQIRPPRVTPPEPEDPFDEFNTPEDESGDYERISIDVTPSEPAAPSASRWNSVPEPASLPEPAAPPPRKSRGESTSRSTPPTAPGHLTEIAGYVLEHPPLGSGAFGAVYKSFDTQLKRPVAIKIPHPQTLTTQDARDRFLREAEASAQFRHENIVPVYGAGEDRGHLFIASAYIDGESLEQRLSRGPIPPNQAADIARQLAEALAYAHDKQIIHRDVKPSNILMETGGRPQVMDFGLARLEGTREKLTQDGSIVGTPSYMSPEQAQGDQAAVGPASDQYSLGVLLYEMLSGQVPFEGPTEAVIYQVLETEPPRLPELNAELPRDLVVICEKAMRKDAPGRYASCHEFAVDLQAFLDNEPILARPMSASEKVVRWVKKRPIASGSIGLIAMLLVAVAALGLRSIWYARIADQNAEIAQENAEKFQAESEVAAANARRAKQKANEAKRKAEELEAERKRTAAAQAEEFAALERERIAKEKENAAQLAKLESERASKLADAARASAEEAQLSAEKLAQLREVRQKCQSAMTLCAEGHRTKGLHLLLAALDDLPQDLQESEFVGYRPFIQTQFEQIPELRHYVAAPTEQANVTRTAASSLGNVIAFAEESVASGAALRVVKLADANPQADPETPAADKNKASDDDLALDLAGSPTEQEQTEQQETGQTLQTVRLPLRTVLALEIDSEGTRVFVIGQGFKPKNNQQFYRRYRQKVRSQPGLLVAATLPIDRLDELTPEMFRPLPLSVSQNELTAVRGLQARRTTDVTYIDLLVAAGEPVIALGGVESTTIVMTNPPPPARQPFLLLWSPVSETVSLPVSHAPTGVWIDPRKGVVYALVQGRIFGWNTRNGTLAVDNEIGVGVDLAEMSSDGRLLITTGPEGLVLHDMDTRERMTLAKGYKFERLRISDGDRGLVALTDGGLQIFALPTGTELTPFIRHDEPLRDAIYCPRGACFITVDEGGEILSRRLPRMQEDNEAERLAELQRQFEADASEQPDSKSEPAAERVRSLPVDPGPYAASILSDGCSVITLGRKESATRTLRFARTDLLAEQESLSGDVSATVAGDFRMTFDALPDYFWLARRNSLSRCRIAPKTPRRYETIGNSTRLGEQIVTLTPDPSGRFLCVGYNVSAGTDPEQVVRIVATRENVMLAPTQVVKGLAGAAPLPGRLEQLVLTRKRLSAYSMKGGPALRSSSLASARPVSLAVAPDETRCAVGYDSGWVEIRELPGLSVSHAFAAGDAPALDLHFLRRRDMLVCCSSDSSRLYDLGQKSFLWRVTTGADSERRALVSSDDRWLVADGRIVTIPGVADLARSGSVRKLRRQLEAASGIALESGATFRRLSRKEWLAARESIAEDDPQDAPANDPEPMPAP